MRVRIVLFIALLLLSCTPKSTSNGKGFTLSGPARVYYDSWGNAHIFARSQRDAVYLQCYEAARLRGFQLDYLFRNITGRLSEWFGKEYLEADRARRILGFERSARKSWEDIQRYAPREAEIISACASGINQFFSDARHGVDGATLPPEFSRIDPTYVPPPVEPWAIVAVGKGIAFELSFSGDREFLSYLLYALLGREKFSALFQFAPLKDTTIIDREDATKWLSQEEPSAFFLPKRIALSSPKPSFASKDPLQAITDAVRAIKNLRGLLGSPSSLYDPGSNNWVIAGRHTESGYPILANDPHLGFDLPPKFLETHLVFTEDGEEFNVSGIILAGGPGVLIGHNQYLGWVLTTTQGDVTDIYLETLSPDGTKVWRNNRWIPLEIYEETICVRPEGGRVGDCIFYPLAVRIVPEHGPLLNDLSPGLTDLFGNISLRWTGFEPTREIVAILRLNRARNLASAMEVLKDFMVGEQNFIMADRDGNIGYMAPARIPIRNWDLRSYPPYLPLPGDGSFEWEGYYDYIWVPQVINPRKGFIVTANNDPLGTTLDGDLFNDPFYLGNFYDFGARAYRITELITEGIASQRKFTPEVIRTIQWDVYSILAEEFLPHLLSLKPIVCNDTGSLPCQAMKILEGWDRINRADSPAPTLFHLWLAHLIDQIFADDIPLFYVLMDLVGQRELQVFARVLKKIFEDPATLPYDFVDLRTTPQREGLEEIMLLAFQKTLEHSQRAFTDDRGNPLPPSDWQWGKMHTIFFQHLAFSDESRGPLPYHGGKGVVDASDYAFFTNEGVAGPPVVQRAGPNMRLIMKMTAEGWETYNILPGGASGDPRSPHYDDQLFLWLQGENRRIPYTREEVERSAIESRIYPQGFPEVR